MPSFFYYYPSEARRGAGTTVRLWRIYYGDGSTFDSNDGTWEEAPSENVQIVSLYEATSDAQGRPTRYVFSGSDYYFKDGDMFGDSFNDRTKVKGSVKYGLYLSDEDFDLIRISAFKDYSLLCQLIT